jgi:hypothetical protein
MSRPGLSKASHLETVDVIPALVGPCDTHAVKAIAGWEGLHDLCVQDVDVGWGELVEVTHKYEVAGTA